MATTDDHSNIRSEEVQDILSYVPNWMILYGNVVIFTIIIMLFAISYFVEYPDVVVADVVVTTKVPPEKVITKTSGTIEALLVHDDDYVEKNTVLAIIANSAAYKDVLLLKSAVDSTIIEKANFYFPVEKFSFLVLGEASSDYALFEARYYEFQLTKTIKIRNESISLKSMLQSFYQLKKSIHNWESRYLLKSSIYGKVSFLSNWNEKQNIEVGTPVFSVIPVDNSGYIGKAKVPIQNYGKLKVGQNANIRLRNYPDTEFGMLTGVIKNISLVPDKDGFYQIDLKLANALVTTHNKRIELKQELSGTAEIITNELSLLDRFLTKSRIF